MDQSEVLKFEQLQLTWKLSDAILEGSKLRGRCRFNLFKYNKSCAMGAAYEAVGLGPEEMQKLGTVPADVLFLQRIPDMEKAETAFIQQEHVSITYANDILGWKREVIAAKLKALGY
jgi:hypothetical protein